MASSAILPQAFRGEGFFRDLAEAAPDALVVLSEGRIVFVNGQAEKLFGYPRDELLGQSVEILIPERYRDVHRDHRDHYVQEPRPRQMGAGLNLTGRHKDSTEFPIEISLSPVQTANGLLVSSAIRAVRDRRREVEQRFLAGIVDSSADAIIGKTLAGVILSWNEGAHRLFGYSAGEAVGKLMSMLIPPGREAEEVEILGRLKKGERVETFDTVRRRKDGRDVEVSVTMSPVHDAAGNVIGVSKVVRDITERKRAEIALARAKDVAEAASRELEAFSYSVAHDLRAPLRGMNGFAQLLLDCYTDKLDAQGKDWLSEILQNARAMGTLIDALLSLSRVTRSALHRESVDLSAVVRASASQLSTAEPRRAVEMVIQDQLRASLDPILARSLIDNLLDNAWKFTRKVPGARIEFGATEKDGARTFYLRDNGAGFDMAFAGKLFAPFQRLHTLNEFPGTGIGLATVQRIVQRHGGRVWAEGIVDGGATFHFAFPADAGGT